MHYAIVSVSRVSEGDAAIRATAYLTRVCYITRVKYACGGGGGDDAKGRRNSKAAFAYTRTRADTRLSDRSALGCKVRFPLDVLLPPSLPLIQLELRSRPPCVCEFRLKFAADIDN